MMKLIERIYTDLFSAPSVSLRENAFLVITQKCIVNTEFLFHHSLFLVRYSLFLFLFLGTCNLGFGALNLGLVDSNVDSLRTALPLANDDTNMVNILNAIGWELKNTNPDTSIILSNHSLSLSKKLKWKKGIANSLGNLGVYNYYKGDYPLALGHYIKALEIERELGNKSKIAINLGNIGIVYSDQGDYPKALEHYFKVLEISKELGDKKRIAICLGNIGVVYYEQGNYPKALEHYFKALEIGWELRDKMRIADNFGNIGTVYNDQGEYPKALEYFFKALKIDKELGNKRGIAIRFSNIGVSYMGQGDYPNALEYFFKALEISQELGDKRQITMWFCNIGSLYTAQKLFADAEDYLNKSLLVAEEIGSLENVREANLNFSVLFWELAKGNRQLAKKNQNYNQAFYHYQQHLQYKDTLFSEEKSESMGKLEARHEFALIEMERGRKEKEEQEAAAVAVKRRNQIQFTGLAGVLIVVVLIVLLILFSKFNIAPKIKMGSLFIALILLFEFMLVWFDPAIEKFTGGNPAYKLFLNALLALSFYFVQQTMEKFLPATVKTSVIKLNTIAMLIICTFTFAHLCGYSFAPLRENAFHAKNAKKDAKDAKIDSLKLLLSQYDLQSTSLHSQNKMKQAFETLKKYGNVKDTLQKLEQSQEEAKVKERQAMEIQKQRKKQEEKEKGKREKEKKERKNLLIYSIILISIIFLFIAFSVSGRLHSGKFVIPHRVLEGGLFVSFLLFFEFILVFADPYIEQYTGGAPAWKFGFNVVLAGLIFPVHMWLEGKMRGKVFKAKRSLVEGRQAGTTN